MSEQRLKAKADAYIAWCEERGTMPQANELAAQLGMSATKFSNDFLAEVGMRPGEYLKRQHVLNTICRIKTSRVDYATIAREAGFGSRTTLHRAIRRITGRTPDSFRR